MAPGAVSLAKRELFEKELMFSAVRPYRVYLNANGRAAARRMKRRAKTSIQRVLSGLPPEETDILHRALEKLFAGLNKKELSGAARSVTKKTVRSEETADATAGRNSTMKSFRSQEAVKELIGRADGSIEGQARDFTPWISVPNACFYWA